MIGAAARWMTYQYAWEYWVVGAVVILALAVWLWGVFQDHKDQS